MPARTPERMGVRLVTDNVSLVLRGPLFVPGNQPKMLDKAMPLTADALIPDMEDSVPEAERAGRGSTSLDGQVVDVPVVKRARQVRQVLVLAERTGREDAGAATAPRSQPV